MAWKRPRRTTILRGREVLDNPPWQGSFAVRFSPRPISRPSTRVAAFLALAALVCTPGCVQRRLTIRSNPPGAVVYVDNQEIGTTPISTDFIYYGTREIRLVKDGYETLTVMQPVTTPWYEIPPLDFVSENFVPGEIRDQRTFTYNLVPQMVVPTDILINRAEQLRAQSHATGAAQAASGTLPPPRPAAPVVPSPFPPPQVQQQSILPQPQSGQGQTGQPTDAQSTPVRPLPPR